MHSSILQLCHYISLLQILRYLQTHRLILLPLYVRGKPTASSLLADGFLLMVGPNFQPSDGNLIVISILRQLADEPENVPEL